MKGKRAKPFRLSYLLEKERSVGFGVSAKVVCKNRGAADEKCRSFAGPKVLRDDALYVVRAVDSKTGRVHLVGVESRRRKDGTETGWNPRAFISLPLLKFWHAYLRLKEAKRAARRKRPEADGDWERDPEWWDR